MLEAHDLQAVDKVLSFLGAIVNTMCEKERSPDVTKVITSYLELLMFVRRKHLAASSDEEEFVVLERKLSDFRAIGKLCS